MTPKSFGYVEVATPTTLVRATVNETDPTLHVPAQAVLFQAFPENTGIVYVGLGNMDVTTGEGVLGFIPAPVDPTTGPFPSLTIAIPNSNAALGVESFYLDAEQATDGALVSCTAG